MRYTPLFLIMAMIVLLGVSLLPDNNDTPSPMASRQVPHFVLPSLYTDGTGIDTASLPDTPILLNVFASWCAACLIEHPFLMELQQQNILPIYGINWRDTPEKATALLKKHGNPYTAIGVDPDSNAAVALGISGAPESYLIASDGTILYHIRGIITPEIFREDIAPLL